MKDEEGKHWQAQFILIEMCHLHIPQKHFANMAHWWCLCVLLGCIQRDMIWMDIARHLAVKVVNAGIFFILPIGFSKSSTRTYQLIWPFTYAWKHLKTFGKEAEFGQEHSHFGQHPAYMLHCSNNLNSSTSRWETINFFSWMRIGNWSWQYHQICRYFWSQQFAMWIVKINFTLTMCICVCVCGCTCKRIGISNISVSRLQLDNF